MPRASTVVVPAASVRAVHVKSPPMLSGSAGVMVTLHSPAVELNSTGPSGPLTTKVSARSALVSSRLRNDVPVSPSSSAPGPSHVSAIGAGGGAQTAEGPSVGKTTVRVRSPDTSTVATPVASGLSGAGAPLALADGADGDGAGGETEGLVPWPTPVELHEVSAAPTTRIVCHRRIAAEPTPRSGPTRTYDPDMTDASEVRPAGSVPASVAAGVAFATTVVYVIVIVSQGEGDVLATILIAAYFAGLGVCALAGARRTGPDRVVPLGAATGGLIGVAIVALFSIGFLFLIGGLFALAAWMRASVGASPRHQVLAAAAAVATPLLFLALVLVF